MLKSTVESMERALEQKETKIERALKDMVSLKDDMDRRLFDKDEELQNMRYANSVVRFVFSLDLLVKIELILLHILVDFKF